MESQEKYIAKLQQENEKLSRKNFSLTRESNELKKSLSEAEEQVSELLLEIEQLQGELETLRSKMTPAPTLRASIPVKEFLSPKIAGWGEESEGEGLEIDWEWVMMLFTDEIFVESDEPDLPIYFDKDRNGYRSFQGSTFIKCPIFQKKLDDLGVIKVRKATEEELKSLSEVYKL